MSKLGVMRRTSFVELDPASWQAAIFITCLYSSVLYITIGVLGMLHVGNEILGKNSKTGQLPLWSLILFFPFHTLNHILVRMKYGIEKNIKGNPPANKILDNLYVGSLFSQEIADGGNFRWEAVVDLTAEFSELCDCKRYLNLPVHDGNPPTLEQFDHAVDFVKENILKGAVLIHCAYGVGRSATVASACIYGMQKRPGVLEAFAAVKASRSMCRLNTGMRKALVEYERERKFA
eukprot:jgi/Bigna1/67899/fgenesh1_pg.4_\